MGQFLTTRLISMDLLLIIDVFFWKKWKPERLAVFFKEENENRPERPVFVFIAFQYLAVDLMWFILTKLFGFTLQILCTTNFFLKGSKNTLCSFLFLFFCCLKKKILTKKKKKKKKKK